MSASKRYHTYKKDCSWNPSTRICENIWYLKIIVGNSVIVCNDIINVVNVKTYVTNTISTNVTRTVSITSNDKKVRCKMDCYIFRTVLLVIILLSIFCYYYFLLKSLLWGRQRNIGKLTIQKVEKNNGNKIFLYYNNAETWKGKGSKRRIFLRKITNRNLGCQC